MNVAFSPSYSGRLTDRDLDRFPDSTLFHRLARTVPCRLARTLAIDIKQAMPLERAGYRIWTQTIPADLTPKDRLLLGKAGVTLLTTMLGVSIKAAAGIRRLVHWL